MPVAAARRSGQAARHRRGDGLEEYRASALARRNKAGPRLNCTASTEIERVVVRQAGADVGQGAHTVFVQMAAEAVGVPVEKVQLIGHDTAETDNSGSSSASRMTFMAGNAIRGAAELALRKMAGRKNVRPIATFQYRPPKTTPYDPETGQAEPNFAYGYMAQFVEVEVDLETGHVRRGARRFGARCRARRSIRSRSRARSKAR